MTSLDNPIDLRAAFGKFATGVTVITTGQGDDIHGMTANSFTSVSMHPPMLLVCVSKQARAFERITRSGGFGVSVLAEHQGDVSIHFAGRPNLDDVVFANLSGSPTIKDAIAQFSCVLRESHDAGDHAILVGEITNYTHCDGRPLLFHNGRYTALS